MTKFKSNQIFTIYIIIFIIVGLIFNIGPIKAEELLIDQLKASDRVFQIEIDNTIDFELVKKHILRDDVKYIVHTEALAKDLLLSEVVASDLDYSTYEVQQVKMEVLRFADSKAEKIKIDSVTAVVNLEFVDTTPPEIIIKKESVTITEGQKLNVDDYVASITDNSFDEITLHIESDIDTTVAGTYEAIYTATDSSGNSASKTLAVIVKEKPKPKPILVQKSEVVVANNSTTVPLSLKSTSGKEYYPSLVTRYGYDCRGCAINADGFATTAAGIKVGADIVRQANGQWMSGHTYEGYHIVATSKMVPLFSILKISNHPFSGGGITAGQPFYAIVGDRGVGGTTLDLFIGTENNLNAIRQSGNPRSSNTKVEIVRNGR